MSLLPLPTPAVQPSELIPNSGGVFGALYTADQLKAYGQACREAALLDAMNATLPFGKVGIVIASAIRSLK